jgi:hypothetical protein
MSITKFIADLTKNSIPLRYSWSFALISGVIFINTGISGQQGFLAIKKDRAA